MSTLDYIRTEELVSALTKDPHHLYQHIVKLSQGETPVVNLTFGRDDREGLVCAKYSREYQRDYYGKPWDPIVALCRGVVFDITNPDSVKLVALPFSKFFNLNEGDYHKPHSREYVEGVYEKYDGSLGIAFVHNDNWIVTTSGSLNSTQAIEATEWLRSQEWRHKLDRDCCYMFELILPGNKIVVEYGDRKDMVLLGARKMKPRVGDILSPERAMWACDCTEGGPTQAVNKTPNGTQRTWLLDQLQAMADQHPAKEFEGYIVVYNTGNRLKIKNKNYVEMHRNVGYLTFNRTFDQLRAGTISEWYLENQEELWPQIDAWVNQIESLFQTYQLFCNGWLWYIQQRLIEDNIYDPTPKQFAMKVQHVVPPQMHHSIYHFNTAKNFKSFMFTRYDSLQGYIDSYPVPE